MNGVATVKVVLPKANASKLSKKNYSALEKIVGADKLSTSDYDRLDVAYGQTAYDLMRIRQHKFEHLPDAVIYPSENPGYNLVVVITAKNDHILVMTVYESKIR